MIKTGIDNGFLISVVGFLSLLNLALILKIPLILQITGIIALGIVPGYLLCLLFRIEVSDWYENFFYWIGLSINFDIFFALVINLVLPIFGDNTPLSPINLQIGYTVIILILTLLIVYTGQVPVITSHPLHLGRLEKIFLIFSIILIVGFETGIYLININSTNLILIVFILLIPLILGGCIVFYNDALKRVFPFIILMVSSSLMMILPLRTNYLIGMDVHEEYFLFISTLAHSFWFPYPSLLLSAATSITILPVVFENFLFIDPQLLFKLLFPSLFVITPLIIFTIVKKYFSEMLALFAACYVLFQKFTLGVSANARTSVAIFFFALIVMVLCNKELGNTKKHALLLLFITGIILSHYTTSFLFLFIIFIAYLMDLIFTWTKNRMGKRVINLPLILFTMCLIFFWYQQIIDTVFSSGLEFTMFRSNIFYDMLKQDVSSYIPYVTRYFPPPSVLLRVINYTRLALQGLIGFGILTASYNFIRKKHTQTTHTLVSDRVSGILIFIGSISYVILILGIFAPFLFFQYDTGRIEGFLLMILPVFLIMGVYSILSPELWGRFLPEGENNHQTLIDFFMLHREKTAAIILLILLVPQLLFATEIHLVEDRYNFPITLNSPKSLPALSTYQPTPIFSYTFVQDDAALKWYKEVSDGGARIYADNFGTKKITSLVARPSSLYQISIILNLPESDTTDVYFFLTFANNYFGRFSDPEVQMDISSMNLIFSQKNKIFSNGALIYH